MKYMRKILAMALAVMMVMSLAIGASAASITITPADTEGGTETGITYTAYKIFDATIEGTAVAYTIDANSVYFNTVKNSGYFTLTQVGDTTTYVVAKTDDYTNDTADDFAASLVAVENKPEAGTLTEQEDGTYKLNNLDDGYYLVTSSVGSNLILDTIGDIKVNTKNTYPSLEKKVEGKDSTTADMGEELTFTIDVTIPATAVGEIVVHDNMTGLQYVSMTDVDGINANTTNDDGCEVEFTLSETYVAANKGTTVTITYTAKVTADVANNEAWLVDDTYTSKTDDTDVYSTDIVINKYDGSDNTKKLEGAEFVLKNSEGKFYAKDAQGNVTWVDDQKDATTVTTDENGEAEFSDIADGDYYLVETKAPTGYNLLTEPQKVTVTANPSTNADGVTTVVAIPVNVPNSSGSELPETGGMGTTLFYVFGAAMVLGAAVLLITKRRMNVAE